MDLHPDPGTHQSPAVRVAPVGTWKLGGRRAMSLVPRAPGTFMVAHGRLWVTVDGPHCGAGNDRGDRVLGTGERLVLARGQRLVVEALDRHPAAYFSWDPLPRPVPAPSARLVPVLQAAADLQLALAFGAGAAGRLARGLVVAAFGAAGRRTGPVARACIGGGAAG